MINFDAVDFSECCFKEVMFLFRFSVYAALMNTKLSAELRDRSEV